MYVAVSLSNQVYFGAPPPHQKIVIDSLVGFPVSKDRKYRGVWGRKGTVTEGFPEESQPGGGIRSGDTRGRGRRLVLQTGQQQVVKQIRKRCLMPIHQGRVE